MGNRIDELNQLLAPAIAAMEGEVFLWGIEFVPGTRQSLLRLYIDAEGRPVGLADCEAVSREISALLDVEDPIPGNYNLEVSSPGLDRPLFELAHYQRFVGEVVKIALVLPQQGRRRVQGPILRVEGELIHVGDASGEVAVASGNIQKARLVPQFETPAKAPRRGKSASGTETGAVGDGPSD